MHKETDYTYRVSWSEEDNEFIGTVAEFPLLSYSGKDQAEVMKGIVEVVKGALELLQEEES